MQPDDQAFINDMDARFKGISRRFWFFEQSPAHSRVAQANEMLASMPRTGFLEAGISFSETENVLAHVMFSVEWAKIFIGENAIEFPHVKKLIEIHDLPEAIISDFNPKSGIETHEKRKLETLAADVIFEGFPNLRANFDEFRGQKTYASKLANDIEKFQTLVKVNSYTKKHPELAPNFIEFWENLHGTWRTETGMDMYLFALRENRKIIAEFAENGMDIEHFRILKPKNAAPTRKFDEGVAAREQNNFLDVG